MRVTIRGGLYTLLAFLAALGIIGVATALWSGDPPVPTESSGVDSLRLRRAVTAEGILEHARELEDIAEANGHTRAAGTPGYRGSREYVAERLRAAGYDVRVQYFGFPFFHEREPAELERFSPDPRDYEPGDDFRTMRYSGSGAVTAGLRPVDVSLPPGDEPDSSTSGCEKSDFDDFTEESIALVQRGTCPFRDKVRNAREAGASAVLIFNEGQEGRREAVGGTLGDPGAGIPVLGTSFEVGEELVRLARDGDVSARVFASTVSETRTASNVMAETRTGRADRTIMAGAHLDSVPDGPGINDNGSGVAMLLEIAEEVSELGIEPQNRVRFAFWGSEELGLLGSRHYVNGLDERELGEISFYLNFDVVGSPNYARFIYEGSGDSAAVEKLFADYFDSRNLGFAATDVAGRSDHAPFAGEGVPTGGLFSGAEGLKTRKEATTYGGEAGQPYDECYHEACDDAENLNTKALDEMSDAGAHAILSLARTG